MTNMTIENGPVWDTSYPIENEDFFIATLVYQRVIVNINVMLFGPQWNVANKKHEDIYIYPKGSVGTSLRLSNVQ